MTGTLGAAVVLAAGGGTRFLGPTHKLLAPFRGRPIVRWAVETAVDAGLDEVIVVEGAVPLGDALGELVGTGTVRLVRNDQWAHGQAGSLQRAVAAARSAGHRAITVGLGDQPLLDPAGWRAVAATTVTPIAAAFVGGRPSQPVRLAAEVWPELPTTGDHGARAVIAAGLAARAAGPATTRFPVAALTCPGTPVDIDTLEDLLRWS
jgi:CTP:molybdopterin cytidylyltransferase MocA